MKNISITLKRKALLVATLSVITSQAFAGNGSSTGGGRTIIINSIAKTLARNSLQLKTLWFSYDADKWISRSGGPGEYEGKKIALLTPGFLTHPDTMIHLARYLSNLKIGETKRYDDIWCYHYDSFKSLATLASRLAEDLGPFLEKTKGVDIFAHSMSGLFCRDAISTTLGIYVKNVVLIGVPNGGIPIEVLAQYSEKQIGPLLSGFLQGAIKQCVPAIYDMDEKSEYLEALNSDAIENHSEFKDSVHYYTISGNTPDGFNGELGKQIDEIYHQIDSSLKTDGLISNKSVHFSNLVNESISWGENSAHQAVLPLNHMQLLGGPDGSTAQIYLTRILDDWIQSWSMK